MVLYASISDYRSIDLAMENYYNDTEKFNRKYRETKVEVKKAPDKPSHYEDFFKVYAGNFSRSLSLSFIAAGTDYIDSDGIMKLYTDLGISMEDVVTIVLPYYCKMQSYVILCTGKD